LLTLPADGPSNEWVLPTGRFMRPNVRLCQLYRLRPVQRAVQSVAAERDAGQVWMAAPKAICRHSSQLLPDSLPACNCGRLSYRAAGGAPMRLRGAARCNREAILHADFNTSIPMPAITSLYDATSAVIQNTTPSVAPAIAPSTIVYTQRATLPDPPVTQTFDIDCALDRPAVERCAVAHRAVIEDIEFARRC